MDTRANTQPAQCDMYSLKKKNAEAKVYCTYVDTDYRYRKQLTHTKYIIRIITMNL